jgi:hypothetical protein
MKATPLLRAMTDAAVRHGYLRVQTFQPRATKAAQQENQAVTDVAPINGTGRYLNPGAATVSAQFCPSSESDRAIAEGVTSWKALKKRRLHWYRIGKAIHEIQNRVLEITMAPLKAEKSKTETALLLLKAGFDGQLLSDSGLRSRAAEMYRNERAIEEWLSGCGENDRDRWNHPQPLLAAWKRHARVPKASESGKPKRETAKDANIRLKEELRAANQEIAALKERARDHGERFSLNDSPKDIARVLAGPSGWSQRKFREIIEVYEALMAEHEKRMADARAASRAR